LRRSLLPTFGLPENVHKLTYEKGLDSGVGIFLAFKRMQPCTNQGGPTVENFCKTMGVFTIRKQVI
jgi:hypothetical protein